MRTQARRELGQALGPGGQGPLNKVNLGVHPA